MGPLQDGLQDEAHLASTWGSVVSIPEHLRGGGVLFSSFQTTTDLTLFLKKMKSSIINMQYGISFRSCS